MTYFRLFMSVACLLLCSMASHARCAAVCDSTESTGNTLPPNRYVTTATSIAVGHTNQLNTYLSSLEYTGLQLTLLQESIRRTRLMQGRVVTNSEWRVAGAYTKSPTHDGKEWYLDAGWNGAWLYTFEVAQGLTLMAGAGVEVQVGGTYNTRNGNNPAQLHLAGLVPATGMAVYRFKLWGKPLTARYKLTIPMIGVMFSPVYNESYYEIFLVDTPRENFNFVHLGNIPSIRQQITLDFDLGKFATMRVGFLSDVRQSHLQGIKSHVWSNSLLVGYVKHFVRTKKGDGSRIKFVY